MVDMCFKLQHEGAVSVRQIAIVLQGMAERDSNLRFIMSPVEVENEGAIPHVIGIQSKLSGCDFALHFGPGMTRGSALEQQHEHIYLKSVDYGEQAEKTPISPEESVRFLRQSASHIESVLNEKG